MVDTTSGRHLKDRDLFLLRAEQARSEADQATLEYVRERCRRAEAAWMEMAARADRTEKMRATQIAAKAALAESAEG